MERLTEERIEEIKRDYHAAKEKTVEKEAFFEAVLGGSQATVWSEEDAE